MLGRLLAAAAILVLIGASKMVAASPITFDFNASFGGSNTFSGSFTYNTTATIPPGLASITEQGSAYPSA